MSGLRMMPSAITMTTTAVPCYYTVAPCRYGTIPVVRKTGGLNDTVFDVDDDQERAAAAGMGTNGYSFEGTDPGALDYGLNRYRSS